MQASFTRHADACQPGGRQPSSAPFTSDTPAQKSACRCGDAGQCLVLAGWELPHSHRGVGQCAEADCTLQVHVSLKAASIEVCMGPRTPLRGPLYASIKVEESTWYVQDGLLTVQLLKRNRRGHYANGTSNADTFWMSV